MEYFGDMHDNPEDPELAQARIFLGELERHIATLTRRMQTAPTVDARRALNAELSAVRRYVERLHRCFPGITPARPPS
ncbi:hypothetical protein [Nocardia crassostreae]|uniref:hypothetical protein n=1 Tax=Nocardia crassostreae TaxID=53428 RepID=UPI00082E20D9|nr:hypothetical protein [Nocardia crassostreae]